ncbi:MAG TPA: formate dehydrogenase subunit beta [Acidobacteriota bacterium]|nr:formate dehydrogenase subunit beta [Acidobacteriota bacterium]
MEIRRISATPSPATGVRSAPKVAKLIDTTTCIGCKACEVACQEWNDLFNPEEPEVKETSTFGSYQTLPDLTANFWNLIRFNEYVEKKPDGSEQLHWLMAKDQCMHCEDPGCLKACPSPGAIVQYTNGVVDFQQENCIGCEYCVTGCPFDIPRLSKRTKKVYKCTLCTDRLAYGLEPACIKACPTACLQFGTKDQLVQIANARVNQLKANGFSQASVYDPPGVGGTGVIYVLGLGDHPELYGLPKDPHVPWTITVWKSVIKPLGSIMMVGGLLGALLHYVRYGSNEAPGMRASESEKEVPKQ